MRYHMKVLIVEDEVQLCESLKELLEAENCSVDYVHDGVSAEDYIMTDAYDVVVLDIMLPGMDGIEVLTRIRERGSTVPVLLLTAKKSPNDKISGLDKGADDYLTKPFAPGELMARLRALYR
ncbi:MAG: response regulator transcription factor [Firmicutes bacterium]|nr:response regulator transcription factor [Bacillota bacterium]